MAVDYTTHYADTEKQLVSLLQKVMHLLPTRDLADATEYLAAREYGLALETIAEGVLDAEPRIDPGLVRWMVDLARIMEIEHRPFVKALAR
jgi:hypothetical protein